MKIKVPTIATPITITNTATAAAVGDDEPPSLAWPVVALSKCVVVVDRSILWVDEDVFDFGAAVDVDEKLDTLLAADLWTDDGDDDDDVFRLVNGSVVVSCSTAAMIAL